MEEEIQKIKISALPEALTVSDSDCFLIVQGRKAKRVKPSLMKGKKGDQGLSAYLGVTATHIAWKLGIDGVWQSLISIASLIGPRGEKPIFKKVNGSLMMKYEGEPDTAYVNIFDREELKMKFSDLTPAEVDLLKLHFSDLTADDIAKLQQPATEAAAEVREEMVQISEDVNLLKQDFIDDGNLLKQEFTTAGNDLLDRVEAAAGKVNTDITTAVEALEARAETVISETNTAKVAAETATTNADNATKAAIDAASLADTAAKDTNKATELAVVVTKLAGEKAELARTSADNANTAAGAADDAAVLANEKATLANDAARVADTAAGKANTAIGNAETATKRANAAAAAAEGIVAGIRPNWTAGKESPNYIKNKPEIPTLQVAPGTDTISYVNTDGALTAYRIGDEVRVLEDDEYVFYRLYDLLDGIASWQESGSGTALPGNIYLQGANYYNESVRIIKGGNLNE